jgi:hypothetical protein
LQSVSQGEYAINGFRNATCGLRFSAPKARRISSVVALVDHAPNWFVASTSLGSKNFRNPALHFTKKGRALITALLTARKADVDQPRLSERRGGQNLRLKKLAF